jgi:hypothetical protein
VLKSKWFVIVAALALLVLVGGCASQAGSEPSTAVPGATTETGLAESPVATPDLGATGEITPALPPATEPAATEPATGATTAETEGAGMEMPEQAEEVQTWPVLWDPQIGFEVRYPVGWLVGEVGVTEQDAPITRAYRLAPAGWEDDYSPILVEVSEGSEADFRQAYGEPAETEERNIGPLSYQYESTGAEGSVEHFAVFMSPDNPDLRVVIRDVVTSFGERASANAEFVSLIELVIENFRWRK